MIVELHGAFVWDCDACGREVFLRAVEGDMDEAVMAAIYEAVPVVEHVAFGAVETDDGEMECPTLLSRILVAPGRVTCPHCGAEHETEYPQESE